MTERAKDYFEVVIAGLGGQGVLTIGQLLTEAGAALYPYVSYFPNYGAAMRGGDSECTVILSRQEIAAPALLRPQAGIVMSPGALEEYEPRLQHGGWLILDSSLLSRKVSRSDLQVFALSATETAIELGNRQVANFVLLGAYLEVSQALPLATVEAALEKRLSVGRRQELLELDRRALREGTQLVAKMKA